MILLSSGAGNKVSQARPCKVSIGAVAFAQCVGSLKDCLLVARGSFAFSRLPSHFSREPVSAMLAGPSLSAPDAGAAAEADDLSSLPGAECRRRRGSREGRAIGESRAQTRSGKRSRSLSAKPRPRIPLPAQNCTFMCGSNSDDHDPVQPLHPDGSKKFIRWGARGRARQARQLARKEGAH